MKRGWRCAVEAVEVLGLTLRVQLLELERHLGVQPPPV